MFIEDYLGQTFTHTLVVLAVFHQVLKTKHGTKKQKKKGKAQGAVSEFNSYACPVIVLCN